MDTRPAILLIDDNNDLLEIFQLVLNSKGFSIITARSAEQAITALKTIHPAVIITDLLMPEMSGIEFIRYLKSTPEYKAIPIVAVSSMDAKHLEEARRVGATVVVRKPVDFSALADILRKL